MTIKQYVSKAVQYRSILAKVGIKEVNWGPTGVVDRELVRLDPDSKKHLINQLASHGIKKPPPQYFKDIDEAITAFHAHRKIAQSSKPSVVRANLKAALKAAITLDDKLRRLDGNSQLLVNRYSETGVISDQRVGLSKLIFGLEQAQDYAADYQKGGRLTEYHRLGLAIHVANAIESHLNVKPTSTPNKIYVGALAIILCSATGKELEDVSDLAKRAITHIRKPD